MAQRRQLPVVIQRFQFGQQPVAVADHARIRRIEKGEVLDAAQAQMGHGQDHAGQVGAADLGVREGGSLLVVLHGIKSYADARRGAPAAPLALVRAGLRDGLDRQALDLAAVAVAADTGQTGVDDMADAGHGQRGLGDIGGDDQAAPAVRLEDAVLFARGQAREQGQDFDLGWMVLAQRLGRFAYLSLTADEDQDVAVVRARCEFVDRVQDAADHVAVTLVRILADQRPVACLHRVAAARHFDDGGVVEETREALRVDRGRGDDQFQVGPPGQQRLQVAEQVIDVQAALVRLVDDQRVIAAQHAIGPDLGQQDAVGHQLDVAVAADPVVEADFIADMFSDPAVQFLREPRRHAACRKPAWLGVTDLSAQTQPCIETDLRDLRRLAGTGLATDDDDLVVLDQASDVVASLVDR